MPEIIVGIDIGTRTTVIAYWTEKQKQLVVYKHKGDHRIPSIYYAGQAGLPEGEADAIFGSPRAITNFKIAFWDSDDPSELVKGKLLGWLERICHELKELTPGIMSAGYFCFTYPARRHSLLPEYQKLVLEARFPKGQIDFIDEPTAALYSQEKLQALKGTGLMLDIGAGTTDLALFTKESDRRKRVSILDISSIVTAGNDCTDAIGNLIDGEESRRAFLKLRKAKPFVADLIKEDISDFYRAPENRSLPFVRGIPERTGGRIRSDTFESFTSSVVDVWRLISDEITKQLSSADLRDDHLSFVFLNGGGGLHGGIRKLCEDRFRSRLVTSSEPQLQVAKGAVVFARSRVHPNSRSNQDLRHSISTNVWIEFPEVTRQDSIDIMEEGDLVSLTKPLRGSVNIKLKGDWFSPEGGVFLRLGEERISLGDLRIPVINMLPAWGRHPGKIKWAYDAASGHLTVSVNLNNAPVNYEQNQFHYVTSVVLTVPGRYQSSD